ncbi:hypothetical protein SERLA73DRAFT_181742 [Serpula lacrymans var. lacrymans S7.3]|uniref:AB hydrolase-1 domain-containing protein n=2 Tax=Serpula lacrymans var. lacrymans TaxID=341189 RepID=F8PYL7_SERL3|nr:uncharacterized protein SERLADRAFT_468086 [Serpula lacrymans var. lacrymans S7.9]EGN98980.1 hypothetical protein SERLA73DRAFT_181742 [Serpula lacrymans var. lacrymans S7.3]EGO24568.1 hypothetical protein SERLADRAFT_468086 [Serpula lacrymans var. lacrymans S7.9]
MVKFVSMQELVPLPTGVSLETVRIYPNPKQSSTKLAVCLHPWSWLGGNMNDPVIHTLVLLLQAREYHVIYYNSRGVGKSTGTASFTGQSEANDLKAIVQLALEEIPSIQTVVLVGYSHGSLITSLHPILQPNIKIWYLLLSYPLSPRGFLTLFRSKSYESALNNLVRHPDVNILVVFGDRDNFTSESKYDNWTEALQKEARGDGTGTLQVVKVAGASHFWASAEERGQLEQVVGAWLP